MVNMQFLMLPFENIPRAKGDHPKNTKSDVWNDGQQTCHRDGTTSESQTSTGNWIKSWQYIQCPALMDLGRLLDHLLQFQR